MTLYKKAIFMLSVIISLLIPASAAIPGGGGSVGIAREYTQILNNSELATQVGQLSKQINNQIEQTMNQVTQITNQITMIQDMIYNTAAMPQQLFGNVTQIYSKIKGVMNKTKGISYTMMNFDEEMKKRFKSYASMSDLKTATDFQQEYRKIVDTQMETTRSIFEALNVSWENLENDDTKALEQLQNMAKSAEGRNQIMQSTNQFLGFLSEESLKLRQLIMLQMQMTGTALEAERAEKEIGQVKHEKSLTGIKDQFEGLESYDGIPSYNW